MGLREYAGASKATSLTGAITAAATIINVADATGYPTGAVGPFVITIDAGVTTEEKVLCSGRTGSSLTVQTRGFDGTTASDHGNAASVQHTLSATDIREANTHVNDTTGDPHPQYLTPAEGAALYSASGHSHAAPADPPKTLRIPHTFTISGEVKVTGVDENYIPPFFVPAPPSQTSRLVKVRHRLQSGTSATVSLQRNGIDLPGWTGISVTPTSTTLDAADSTLADEDMLRLVVTAASGTPKHMTVSLFLEYVAL